jgi:arabinose-5-phosphate isomerase
MTSPASALDAMLSGAELILQGADTLRRLSERFDEESFKVAVDTLVESHMPVATTGMGTSGIVARKVAATLTSTGTPATFVHPSDALHGGLGLIDGQGVVVAVSNSGETEEVLSLIPHLKGRGVPVIGIVGRTDSTLGRESLAVLVAAVERELDAHDMVPTASVLAAIAVGDALALTVMIRRGVTRERFARNHPSGSLGRRLTLRVADVIGERIDRLVPPYAKMIEVLRAITEGGKGAAGVGVNGQLVGLVTDGDIRRALERHGAAAVWLVAQDIMNPAPVVIDAETMAYDALLMMEEEPRRLNLLVVMNADGEFRGILRVHDLVHLGL